MNSGCVFRGTTSVVLKSDQGNHEIKLTNDTIPIIQRPYKIPFA